MVAKQVRAAYTQEFRLEAVRLVQSGQSQMQVCQTLGIPKASLGSWVRQVKAGTLSLELPMVLLARSRRSRWSLHGCGQRMQGFEWSEISQKKRRHTSRRTCCEVCLD